MSTRQLGRTVLLQPANPGAGSGLTFVVPLSCRIESVTFVLTADANPANRQVVLLVSTPAALNRMSFTWANQLTTAGQSRLYYFERNPVVKAATIQGLLMAIENLPTGFSARRADELHITVENIQAGDTLTTILLTVTPE